VIHRLKYDGFFALAIPLAQFMVNDWPLWAQEIDILIPIPLHRRRLRKRGFNQSYLLAESIAQQLNITVNDRSLRRVKNTRPQIGLNPSQRQENMRDAFEADAQQISGREILLIDDVYTSGATMSAAAQALLAAGAAGVSAYCLARTVQ
jgi:ComF family protein